MDTKTIYQNMTKGEWQYDAVQDEVISVEKMRKITGGYGDAEKRANGAAIVLMHKNTFGKGIDPRAIEYVFEVAWEMVNVIKNSPNDVWLRRKRIAETLEEALNTAKLNETLQPAENLRADRDR